MSMKLSQLRTYWSAGEAHMILSFLDELKDVLWTVYGAEIVEQQHRDAQAQAARAAKAARKLNTNTDEGDLF